MILLGIPNLVFRSCLKIGAWRRWLAHLVRDQRVTRSNRVAPIVLFFLCAFKLFAYENNAASYNGPTGLMNIPSGVVLMGNEQTISLHRYQIKYTYGLFSLLEAGFKTDLEGVSNFDSIFKKFTFNFKCQLLNENIHYINLSAGAESNNIYVAIDRNFKELYDINLFLGTGSSRFNYFFIGISKFVEPVHLLMLECDGEDINIGWRLTLSQKVKFDLYLLGLKKIYNSPYLNDIINHNVIFGLSYSEFLNIDLRGFF